MFGFGPIGPEFGLAWAGHGGPVTGLPFEATATLTVERPGQNTAGDNQPRTIELARDADGRTRVETTMPAFRSRGGEGGTQADSPQQVIFITDPVAHKAYVLYPARQLATVRNLPPPPPPGGPGPDGGGRGRPHPNATTTSLGQQEIAGLMATGTQRVITLPPPPNAQDKAARTITTATWVSTDLHVVLEQESTRANGGKSDFQVQSLQQGPQDAALFTVPSGYTIRPMHGFGGRGGLR